MSFVPDPQKISPELDFGLLGSLVALYLLLSVYVGLCNVIYATRRGLWKSGNSIVCALHVVLTAAAVCFAGKQYLKN